MGTVYERFLENGYSINFNVKCSDEEKEEEDDEESVCTHICYALKVGKAGEELS